MEHVKSVCILFVTCFGQDNLPDKTSFFRAALLNKEQGKDHDVRLRLFKSVSLLDKRAGKKDTIKNVCTRSNDCASDTNPAGDACASIFSKALPPPC